MKLAVISDIHSNLEALWAAFKVIEAHNVDAIYCLGDIVGYGAEPEACLDLVQKRCAAVVKGNHDEAVASLRGIEMLPLDAQEAARHNREHLSEDQLDYLANLPLKLSVDGFTLVHATPKNPGDWLRLDSYIAAREQFEHFDTDVCFLGHSHVPAVMGNRLGLLRVRPGHRFLINVGSVGQPRDGDSRLCVAFFDTETFHYELVRAEYDIDGAAAKIIAAGLPRRLADRLSVGM